MKTSGLDTEAKIEVQHKTGGLTDIILDFPVLSVADIQMQGDTYQRLKLENLSLSQQEGQPQLPVWRRYVLLPDGQLPNIDFTQSEFSELSGYNVLPAQPLPAESGNEKVPWVRDEATYRADDFYPQQRVQFGPLITVRGQKLVLMSVYPVQFNPQRQLLRVLTSGTLQVQTGTLDRQDPKAMSLLAQLPLLLNAPHEPQTILQKSGKNYLDEDGLSGCDYLIITHPNFLEAAQQLAAWRRLTGLRTDIKTSAEIGSQPGQIRDYLDYAYHNWDIVPEYILILGDAEFIPTNYYTQHPSDGQGHIGTDLYYAAVDGPDMYADIAFGRIPVNTALEALNYVHKVITYEQSPPQDTDFYHNPWFLAYFQDDDDPDTTPNERDGYADRRFVLTSEEMHDYLLQQGFNAQRIYYAKSEVTPTNYNNGGYANGEPLPAELLRSNGFAWDGNASQISTAVNEGTFFISHRDHGSRSGWGEPAYQSGHVAALTNGEKLPLVFSVNCQTGWFDNETDDADTDTGFDNECFVEYWMRNFLGGAIGVFGSTRISYSGYNDALVDGFFDGLWPGFLSTGEPGKMLTMGHALNYGKLYLAAEYSGGSRLGVELEEFHYYGDPAMTFRNQEPQILTVTEVLPVHLNQDHLTVETSTAGVMVSLVQNERLLARAATDAAGLANLEFKPLHSTDSLQICVSGGQYIPYLQTIPVEPALGLTCTQALISDTDGDGLVNMGEYIGWKFDFTNSGLMPLNGVRFTLLCNSPYVQLIDSVSSEVQIAGGQSLSMEQLSFTVANDCPHGTNLSMQLKGYSADSLVLDLPLIVPVEQGRPRLESDTWLLAETAANAGDTLHRELRFRNTGYGVAELQLGEAGKHLYTLADTLKTTWDDVPAGIGNVYEQTETVTLSRFGTYMQVNEQTQAWLFVYEGNDYKGKFNKVAEVEQTLEPTASGYIWSENLNTTLQAGKFYYIGISWQGSAQVSRADCSAPLDIGPATVRTGVVNLGGTPPEGEVTQVITLFTPYLQVLETGQESWVEGLPYSKSLLPGESADVPFVLCAVHESGVQQATLLARLDSDTLAVALRLAIGDSTVPLAADAGRLQGEDGQANFAPGKRTDVFLSVKNLKTETIYSFSAKLLLPDSTWRVEPEKLELQNIPAQTQVDSLYFRCTTPSAIAPGTPCNYRLALVSDGGFTDTLSYSTVVRAGSARMKVLTDSLSVTSATLNDTTITRIEIANNGFGPLQVHVKNPLRNEINSGTEASGSWWPKGTGFGNIIYQIQAGRLQAVRYLLKANETCTFHYFVYEGSELKGTYHLLASASRSLEPTSGKWVSSPQLAVYLKERHYYYIGVSWDGSGGVCRAKETVPYQTSSGVVYSSAYDLGGAPPQQEIEQPYKVSYPVAQQLIMGSGLWFDLIEDDVTIDPGQTQSLNVRFITTYPDTTFTAELELQSDDPEAAAVCLPISFTSTAKATAINLQKPAVPQKTTLYANYPNPFNNSTLIRYYLARSDHIDLSVFNVLGQRIKTLFSGRQQAGVYRVPWAAQNQASGVYFIVLRSKERYQVRKMILLK